VIVKQAFCSRLPLVFFLTTRIRPGFSVLTMSISVVLFLVTEIFWSAPMMYHDDGFGALVSWTLSCATVTLGNSITPSLFEPSQAEYLVTAPCFSAKHAPGARSLPTNLLITTVPLSVLGGVGVFWIVRLSVWPGLTVIDWSAAGSYPAGGTVSIRFQVSGGTLVIRMMPLVELLSPGPLSQASYSMPDPRSSPKQAPSSKVVPSSATLVIRIWPGLSVLTTST